MGRYELCLSSAHRHDECPLVADEDPDIGRRMKAVESAVVAFSAGGQGPQHQQRAREICMLFNDRRCKFRNCKYRHVCEGWHPAVECTKEAKRGPSQHEGLSGGSHQRGQEGLQTHTELGIWTCVVVLSDVSG